jgi:hypothetical protein
MPLGRKSLEQGFSNCGMPDTVQWYTRIVRKNQRIKKYKNPSINAVTRKSQLSFFAYFNTKIITGGTLLNYSYIWCYAR